MLNLKICLVDFSEDTYTVNSLYNQALPYAQREILYLATALAQRPNRITLVGEHTHAQLDQGIQFEPWPEDAAHFWQAAAFDVVICLDSAAGCQQIRPHLPAGTPLILWTHLPPQHLAMMPLQHAEVRACFQAVICENALLRDYYQGYFGFPAGVCHYRYPTMVRTLRKRFFSSQMLAAVRAPALTLAFTAHPAQGLDQMLEMYELLSQGFSDLRLRVFCPPGLELEHEPQGVQRLVARCRQTPGVEVIPPLPWPTWVEALLVCHVHCNPLSFADPAGAALVDPLAAGCQIVAAEHPGLRELGREHIHWVAAEPESDYFQRYTQTLSAVLERCLNEPETLLAASFRQATYANTLFTWDLRVWEWESLLYRLVQAVSPDV
ncbi:MAG: hypothetical protein ACO1RX_01970 [Candidatus Sericytochromatia bacterium]